MTPAELKLWNAVRAHRLVGLGFRRQFPIGAYIVDFACPDHRLAIEVDGSGHGDDRQAEAGQRRTWRMEQDRWLVLRLWNDDVLRDIDGVCQHIVSAAGQRSALNEAAEVAAAGRIPA